LKRGESKRTGVLDHDEVSALIDLRAGRCGGLISALRDKSPLSREILEEIAAMLAVDGRSAWQLELKRRRRGRPPAGGIASPPPRLLPLTRARRSLIASMLAGGGKTDWVFKLSRRRAGKLAAAPIHTAANQLAIGEMVAQLLHEGTSNHRDAIRTAAAELHIPLIEESGKASPRFKTRSARLTRLKVRGRKEAVDLVGFIFGLRRSSVETAYKAHREATARLSGLGR
jgi:hypothetical protein